MPLLRGGAGAPITNATLPQIRREREGQKQLSDFPGRADAEEASPLLDQSPVDDVVIAAVFAKRGQLGLVLYFHD